MNQTTRINPEKLAKLREAIVALQADDIEYDYRSPWYAGLHNNNNFEVRSCRNSWVADADCAEVATYIAAADPQTVLALVEEVERLRERVADAAAQESQRWSPMVTDLHIALNQREGLNQ